MKKLIFTFAIVPFLILSSFNSQSQVVVKIRPVAHHSNFVKPARPGHHYTWINHHWKWSKHHGRYVQVQGYWTKTRKYHVYVAGRWSATSRGHQWVSGYWRRG